MRSMVMRLASCRACPIVISYRVLLPFSRKLMRSPGKREMIIVAPDRPMVSRLIGLSNLVAIGHLRVMAWNAELPQAPLVVAVGAFNIKPSQAGISLQRPSAIVIIMLQSTMTDRRKLSVLLAQPARSSGDELLIMVEDWEFFIHDFRFFDFIISKRSAATIFTPMARAWSHENLSTATPFSDTNKENPALTRRTVIVALHSLMVRCFLPSAASVPTSITDLLPVLPLIISRACWNCSGFIAIPL